MAAFRLQAPRQRVDECGYFDLDGTAQPHASSVYVRGVWSRRHAANAKHGGRRIEYPVISQQRVMKHRYASDSMSRLLTPPDNQAVAELPLESWLVAPRRGYTHRGIYVGAGRVVYSITLTSLPHAAVKKVVVVDGAFADGSGWKPEATATVFESRA
jgi:hypothetical protein